MKAIFMSIVALALATALCAVESNRNEVVWWEEDFESAATGWTHYSAPANIWHSVSVWSWWPPVSYTRWEMGNGYTEHQYLVLDTPEQVLTTENATLTFTLRLENIQGTAGASAPYDGWDALNVRISTDGGSTWTPISGSPAYNMRSSYAFGEEFGEGPGIPGWCGNLGGNASFNLSANIGQSVRIRFAFASDSAVSTTNGLAAIDNISFGGYANDGTEDGQMTAKNLGDLCEDIWHVSTDVTAPSPTHILKCQNDQETYDIFTRYILLSPPVELPPSGDIYATFMSRGDFGGLDSEDCFNWEVCGADSVWDDGDGSQYHPSQDWTSGYLILDLNAYAGQTVRFRLNFISDWSALNGTGLFIDDLKIHRYLDIPAPQGLAATVIGTDVTLNWSAPGGQIRDVDFYKVFRDDIQISQVNGDLLTYTDVDVPNGMHAYYLIVMDDVYESEPSVAVPAYVVPDYQTELNHDDGTAESGFTAVQGNEMAVCFVLSCNATIRYVKVFVQTLGTQGLIVRVYDGCGPGPNIMLLQHHFQADEIALGWNYLELPEAVYPPSWEFYISIWETPSESLIGLDDSSSGNSIYRVDVNQFWLPIYTGNLMIRAIVEPMVANDDISLQPMSLLISNYPNPFNGSVSKVGVK